MKIVIIATGLGLVHRGFEVSALEWAHALRATGKVEVLLLSGGNHPDAKQLPIISQTGCVAWILRKLGLISDGARLQQRSFLPAAKHIIKKFNPDYIWLQEATLAVALQKWLSRTASRTKLVFCNGAPVSTSICSQFDLVIDLIPSARESLLSSGYPEGSSALIPHPVKLPPVRSDKENWRICNGFTSDDRIVLSVAAWNSHHKRIDYLIREVAQARKIDNRLKLLLCGQPTEESDQLKQLGTDLLGANIFWKTLPYDELVNAYGSADIFVLASNNEAFGAVIAEAAIMGLPIICNDFPSSHFILGEQYPGIKDLSSPGALAEYLTNQSALRALPDISAKAGSQFSPPYLANCLIDFLQKQPPHLKS